jgi:hypothetical protein
MRKVIVVLGLLALAGCEPEVPDSGRGVGFNDYGSYLSERAAREADLQRMGTDAQARGTPGVAAEGAITSGPLTAMTGVEPPLPGTAEPSTVPGAPVVTVDTNNPGISNTQDFGAVSQTDSIAANAARIQAQREQYRQVAPTPLPSRPTTANAAQFALATSHAVGTKMYSRGPLGGISASANCRRYRSDDDAQTAFLEAGGPERDRLNLDPDGDGFACAWSPDFYRRLVK